MNCGNEMKMKKKKKTVSQPSILGRFSKPSEAINLDLPILKFLQRIICFQGGLNLPNPQTDRKNCSRLRLRSITFPFRFVCFACTATCFAV